MTDKFMYIPNDNTQNYPFCRLKFVVQFKVCTLNLRINQSKFPKVVKERNKKNFPTTLFPFSSPSYPPLFTYMRKQNMLPNTLKVFVSFCTIDCYNSYLLDHVANGLNFSEA